MGRLPDHTCLFQVLCPLELTTETTAHLPREKMITPAPARAGERVSKLRKAKEQRKGSASWNKPRKVRQKKKQDSVLEAQFCWIFLNIVELIFQFHSSAQSRSSILFQCVNCVPSHCASSGSLSEHTIPATVPPDPNRPGKSPTPPQWTAVLCSDRFTNLHQSRCRSSVRALFKHKHLSILTMDSKIRQPFKPPSFSLTSALWSVPTDNKTQQMQPFQLVIF